MTKQFFIIKNGYMFRPDCKGYTASEAEAGRYTEAECDWYRNQEEISFRECTPTPATPQGAPETVQSITIQAVAKLYEANARIA